MNDWRPVPALSLSLLESFQRWDESSQNIFVLWNVSVCWLNLSKFKVFVKIIEVVNFNLGFTISCLQTELGSKFQLLDPLPKIGDVWDKGVIRGLYGGSAIKWPHMSGVTDVRIWLVSRKKCWKAVFIKTQALRARRALRPLISY